MRIRHCLTGTLTLLAAVGATVVHAQALDDDAIRQELRQIVDVRKQGVGLVVGIVDKQGARVIAHGALDQGDPRPLNGDTLFEIGSITKTFTTLLLADMVRRGEVALEDPIAQYLPEGVRAPQRNGRQITLIDLATHTSGLPRMPGNFMPADPANPYADYTAERMYAFLSRHELRRDIGAQFEYSNYGMGLLGNLLARRTGLDYETLLRQRVLDPLKMDDSLIVLTPETKTRLAAGHRADLSPAASWDIFTLAPAGGLRCSMNDMLKYLSAHLGYTHSPLDQAIEDMRQVRRPGGPQADVALGWIVPKAGDGALYTHNGGTGGYRSMLAFNLERGFGVVVLSNTANNAAERLGRQIMGLPVAAAPARKSAQVDPALYEKYVGRYRLGGEFFIDITREETDEGARLFAQVTGQESFELLPSDPVKFFAADHPIEITFIVEGDTAAQALVLHQGGMDTRAARVDPDAPPPAPPAGIKLAPEILDRYVGSYELAPALIIEVSREGDSLFAQLTAQPKFPVYARSEKEFFYTVVDARLTFETDDAGKVTALTLHQGGRDMRAGKLP